MRGLDGKCVIVLDHLADRFGPEILPISVVRDTCEEARGVGQYDGGPPTLVSLGDYTAAGRGTTRLVDVTSGEELPGTLYRLVARYDD